MVDFASDPLSGFVTGYRLGDAMRTRGREEQQRQAYGQAFQKGGFGGVASAAGGMGDLDTATQAQGQAQEQEENNLARVQRSGQVLQRIHQSLAGLPAEERAARLQQIGPGLVEYGVAPEMLAGVDTSDQGWEALGQELTAALGQFQRYSDMQNVPGVGFVGLNPDGSHEVLIPETVGPRLQAQMDARGGANGGRPNAPAGYEWTEDGRQRAIEGGPADYRQSGEARARVGALESSELQLDDAINAIDVATQVMGRNNDWWNPTDDSTGMQGQALRGVGGMNAYDLDQALEPVRATLSFSNLQEMRRNSVTGGALGSIAVRELQLLASTVRSLDTGQSREQLQDNVAAVRAQMVRTREAFRRAREEIAGGQGAATQQTPTQESPAQGDPIADIDRQLEELDAMERQQGGGR